MISTKTLFRWHLWLGLLTGLLLLVIGGSGSVAVFIEEIDWLVTPALRADARAGAPRADVDTLAENVRRAYPEGRLTALNLSVRPSFAHVARVSSPESGGIDVFLDPVTGRINGDRVTSSAYTSTLRNFIRQLHLRLFMGLWGRVFVGFFGVTLVLSCVTGLWIYRGWLRNLFRLRWRGTGARTRGSDLHKLVGVWSLLFNILFGLTGAVYGYENLVNQVRSHWLRSRPAEPATSPAPAARTPRPSTPAGPALPLGELLARTGAAFPDLTVRNILLPANASAPIVLRGDVPAWFVQQSHVRRASFVALDSRTGAIQRRVDGREARGWDRIYSSFDPLHFGYFGGTLTKTIWFILGLAPGVLALTGAWLWWRRTRGLSTRAPSPTPARRPEARAIAAFVGLLTLAGSYVLVARDQGTWALTGKLIEHAFAKPLALALTAFPVTGLLLWLAWQATNRKVLFACSAAATGAWWLTLVTLFQ